MNMPLTAVFASLALVSGLEFEGGSYTRHSGIKGSILVGEPPQALSVGITLRSDSVALFSTESCPLHLAPCVDLSVSASCDEQSTLKNRVLPSGEATHKACEDKGEIGGVFFKI